MSEETLAQFFAQAAVEQRALGLFAVAHGALTRSDMAKLMALADLRSEKGRPFKPQDVTALVERWLSADLVIAVPGRGATGYYRVHPHIQHPLLSYLRERGELSMFARIVREQEPLLSRYNYIEPMQLSREILLATYAERSPDLERALSYFRPGYGERLGDLFVLAMGLEPPSEILAQLSFASAEAYLQCAFSLVTHNLATVGPGPLAFVHASRHSLASATLACAAQYLLLRGESVEANRLLDGLSDAELFAVRCLLALVEADLPSARSHAREALEGTRVKKSRRLKGFNGETWPWVLLALLTDADSASIHLAREQLAVFDKKVPSDFQASFAALSYFDKFLADAHDPAGKHAERLGAHPEIKDWLDLLVTTLVQVYTGASISKASSMCLLSHVKRADDAGFVWLARSLEDVAASEGAGALSRLYAPEQAWERAVRALDTAIALAERVEGNSESTTAQERLVWILIALEDGSHQLTARIQTRNAAGFSSGRQVTWKRLLESAAEAAWLTPEDRKVIAHVKVQRDSGYYGASSSHVLDDEAPASLIAHPRVFGDYECRTLVEVVRGAVRVEVREQEDAITLSLAPTACLTRAVVCERDGESRIVVYVLSAGQRVIAKQLSEKGLSLPKAARSGVERALGKLVHHFPIASEVGVDSESIMQADADPRIHLQLRRMEGGLSIRPCVAPLGPSPTFAPGVGSPSLLGVQKDAEGKGCTVRCQRDLADETRRLERVLAACPTLSESETNGREYRAADLVSCLEVLSEIGKLGDDVVLLWPDGEPLSIAAERGVRDVRLKLSGETAWLAAEGELEVDEGLKLSLRELLERTSRQQGRFVALDDGRFLALSEDLRRHLEALSALARVQRGQVELHPLALLGIGQMSDARVVSDKQAATRLRRVRESATLEPELPTGFEASLRPYQQEGFAWLSRLAHWGAGACLADDMGLGKTLQTLALLLAHKKKGPSLVVAPTSVCANWLDEARKFAPSLRMRGLGSSGREQVLKTLEPGDVLVCSYGLLQQNAEDLAKLRFEVIVLDEAQAIKNASALRTKAAMALTGNVRIALTGTPVENHLGELWSIMNFLNPSLLGTAKAFDERFGKPIQRDKDVRAAQLLKRLVRPFVLRRKKSEVLDDLPEKTVLTLRVAPSEAEQALFAALREQAVARMTDSTKPAEARMRLLAELTRLRRAACHPDLVAPEAGIASSKLLAFEELLEELRQGGHRALVFSQFVDYLSIVRARLAALGVSYQYLDGSSSPTARANSVRAFQAGEGEVFLISLKAGGFGLNLTAADYVVHLDPWWNPATEDQASDRAHRIGQTRPVTIYRLVMEGSIEEKILALHAEKRDLADRLLEGENSAAAIGVEELMNLLKEASSSEAQPKRARRSQGAVEQAE